MNLLRRVERHLRRHGLAPTRFGREAANDPRLVEDLRNGRQAGTRMAARVTAYMDRGDAELVP